MKTLNDYMAMNYRMEIIEYRKAAVIIVHTGRCAAST